MCFFGVGSSMRKLCAEKINEILVHLNKGLSYDKVSKVVDVSKSTVRNYAKKLLKNRIPAAAGRRKLLSPQDKRWILRQIATGNSSTASEIHQKWISAHGQPISKETVRNVLRKSGLKGRAKVKKPLLLKRHLQDRLKFAKKYKNWTVEDWKLVIWSDESKINRLGSDGRKWCWKKTGSDLNSNCIEPTVKFGGGSLMIWGCMTAFGPGYLARIDGGLDAELYCKILQEDLQETITFYKLSKNKVIFQHDNDPKHTSKKAKKCLEELKITVLDWPAQSPDLNPIEHLWDNLKRKLAAYEVAPTSMHELWERIEVEWEKITKEECLTLIESMPRRINAVLKAKGGYTRY